VAHLEAAPVTSVCQVWVKSCASLMPPNALPLPYSLARAYACVHPLRQGVRVRMRVYACERVLVCAHKQEQIKIEDGHRWSDDGSELPGCSLMLS
jgi:hypothetical protein